MPSKKPDAQRFGEAAPDTEILAIGISVELTNEFRLTLQGTDGVVCKLQYTQRSNFQPWCAINILHFLEAIEWDAQNDGISVEIPTLSPLTTRTTVWSLPDLYGIVELRISNKPIFGEAWDSLHIERLRKSLRYLKHAAEIFQKEKSFQSVNFP